MPQYLISVWHDDDYSDLDFSDPDTQRMATQVGAFNETLQQAGAGRREGHVPKYSRSGFLLL